MRVAADLGNGFTKATIDPKAIETFPSQIAAIQSGERLGDAHRDNPAIFCFDGQWLVSGWESKTLGTNPATFRNMNRYVDPFYRQLLAAALARIFYKKAVKSANPKPIEIRLAVNIPVSEYKAKRSDLVRTSLAGTYRIGFLNEKSLIVQLDVENIRVVPEGAGAYFLARASTNMGLETVAVVDTGDFTTNLNVFGRLTPQATRVEWLTGDSSKFGMHQIIEKVLIHLSTEYSYGGDESDVNWALMTGRHEIDLGAGHCLDFATQLDTAARELFNNAIIPFFNTARKNYSPARVIFTGGGSEVLRSYVSLALQSQGWLFQEKGQEANVRGLYVALAQE